jgi:hypothetical protein
MTRFHLQLSKSFRLWGARRRFMLRRFIMMDLAALDPRPLGPGWFDSSWELWRGLVVKENARVDANLKAWLESCQRERQAAREPVERVEPVKFVECVAPVARPAKATNLIEFELEDIGNWQGQRPRGAAPKKPASFELDLALA